MSLYIWGYNLSKKHFNAPSNTIKNPKLAYIFDSIIFSFTKLMKNWGNIMNHPKSNRLAKYMWKMVCIVSYFTAVGNDLSGRRLLTCFSFSIFLSFLAGMKSLQGALKELYLPKQTSKRFKRNMEPLDYEVLQPPIWQVGKTVWLPANNHICINVCVFWFQKAAVSTSVGKKSRVNVYCSENNKKKRTRLRKQSVRDMCHASSN